MVRRDIQIPVCSQKAKARSEPRLLRRRAEQAWRMRWSGILSCTAVRAFASSLLELCATAATDGPTPPTHEVLTSFRHAGVEG